MKTFHFKQFSVQHAQAAMKVGTDGVLLGAWAKIPTPCKHLLDIGTGTGLIALMLAQRSTATVDAVEIDPIAAEEAKINAAKSPWANRIAIHHNSIQQFAKNSSAHYDLIVSNPPFFNAGAARNAARHTLALSHEDLVQAAAKLLAPSGIFCLILPLLEGKALLEIAYIEGLYPNKITRVKPRNTKEPNRLLLELGRDANIPCIKNSLTIREENGYSSEYSKLTEAFYLG